MKLMWFGATTHSGILLLTQTQISSTIMNNGIKFLFTV